MSLFVIGDLHLSFGSNKPMDIFDGWDNYILKLKNNWENSIKKDDVVVIVGDVSWAINFNELYKDFKFIDGLPGIKIIIKGNHDYWFTTKTKVDNYIKENEFSSINILYNNSYDYNEYSICGTRGWMNEKGVNVDNKVLLRECGRLERSLMDCYKKNKIPLVFLHYPPVYLNGKCEEIVEILNKYNVSKVYYGHLHGKSCGYSINGKIDNIDYKLISSDFLQFYPFKII